VCDVVLLGLNAGITEIIGFGMAHLLHQQGGAKAILGIFSRCGTGTGTG